MKRHEAGGLGIAEIADLLEVEHATVSQWRQRGLLPPPDHRTARADLWDKNKIIGWAERTGRWPHDKT